MRQSEEVRGDWEKMRRYEREKETEKVEKKTKSMDRADAGEQTHSDLHIDTSSNPLNKQTSALQGSSVLFVNIPIYSNHTSSHNSTLSFPSLLYTQKRSSALNSSAVEIKTWQCEYSEW